MDVLINYCQVFRHLTIDSGSLYLVDLHLLCLNQLIQLLIRRIVREEVEQEQVVNYEPASGCKGARTT